MAIIEYEDRIKDIVNKENHDDFIFEFLSVYEKIAKSTITKLRNGINDLSKNPDEVHLKNKLFFKKTSNNIISECSKVEEYINSIKSKPRYIIITDFSYILAEDTKTKEKIYIKFKELPKYFEFFLAWNGVEKSQNENESPADIKAAEHFARIYDQLLKENKNVSKNGFNLFLIRLLFCMFAEDTGIFKDNAFTDFLKMMTSEDGSDMNDRISELFSFLDKKDRTGNEPAYLLDFPYVNGQLFTLPHENIKFSKKTRDFIIDAGELIGWYKVNPDILGSMLQAVASENKRSNLGMHYTSVTNIMKVIKPLFLDDLRNEFENSKGNEDKLNRLLVRISKIKFMDPTCGSGNFLIITYKKLRELEMDILLEQRKLNPSTMYIPNISLNQFYGIEIDDFASDVTRLSLWIADHQMNKKLEKKFNDVLRPTLPLKKAGAIICGNSLNISWKKVLKSNNGDEVYIFGNPPYLNEKLTKSQKEDKKRIFKDGKNTKKLDYVCCWFLKAAEYNTENVKSKFAFIATNSVYQGSQVAPFFGLMNKNNVESFFAYRSFKWSNNAKRNANVTIVVVGYENKYLEHKSIKKIFVNSFSKKVQNISPYLTESNNNIIVKKRRTPIGFQNKLTVGCRPNDNSLLVFSEDEYNRTVSLYPESQYAFREYIGGKDYINHRKRHILWLNKHNVNKFKRVPIIKRRLEKLSEYRLSNHSNLKPYELQSYRNKDETGWFIPQASSSNRYYVPMGYINDEIVISDPNFVLYNPKAWECALLISRMHMVWFRAFAGRLESRLRYSSILVYNTFPIPKISDYRKKEMKKMITAIEDIRSESGESLFDLYGSPLATNNPIKMNPKLKEAHEALDSIVDRIYKPTKFKDDKERLSLLLDMYSKKIKEEK